MKKSVVLICLMLCTFAFINPVSAKTNDYCFTKKELRGWQGYLRKLFYPKVSVCKAYFLPK